MTKTIKKSVAFLSAAVMVMAMLLYFPSGIFSIDFGLKASAAATITLSAPTEGDGSSDNPYQISTKEELYWFAAQVNSGNTSANAVLTKNITVNTNVLGTNGTLNSGSFTSWTPIGNSSNKYTGTFDGKGFTVSGLYFSNPETSYVGLFGYNKGTIKNVGVEDSYFNGKKYVGGVCGENFGTITNCYNTGNVSGTGTDVGGVCGENYGGTITNCHNTGAVSGTDFYVGGVCGYNENGTITSCYNSGTVISSSLYVGGVCGYNCAQSGGTATITNCYNTGAVSGTTYVGGVCGFNNASNGTATITNCNNKGTLSGASNVGGVSGYNSGLITNCYNTGNVSGTGTDVGGVCGQNCAQSGVTATITNCYNRGTVSGSSNIGGVCGQNSAYSNGTATITNCYNTGTVSGTGNYIGGVCGKNRAISNETATIANCYYLATEETDSIDGTTFKTSEQFGSGEVAYLLSQGENDSVWGQDLSVDDSYPVLDSTKKVYRNEIYTGCSVENKGNVTYVYANESAEPTYADHNYNENGFCESCNGYKPATWNVTNNRYEISNAGQLYWFAAHVNSGNTSANAVLTKDITVNTGVLETNGTLNSGSFTSWTPIGNNSNRYTGTFDGQNHKISGLYFNNPGTNCVGLFGCVGIGGSVSNVGVVDSYFKGKDRVGGVCGFNINDSNGTATATITNCYNTGNVTGGSNVGGVCGESRAYYNKCTATITNCYNTGAVSGNDKVGGVCGFNFAQNGTATITNCYNTGSVSGSENVGGVCGGNHVALSGAKVTITNCYNSGSVNGSGDYVGGVCEFNFANSETATATITDCYYLATGETDSIDGTTFKTSEQFGSGEVCYLLNKSTTDGSPVWYQTIDSGTKDAYPLLDSTHGTVYASAPCPSKFSNTNKLGAVEHIFAVDTENRKTHKCTKCGETHNAVFTVDEAADTISICHGFGTVTLKAPTENLTYDGKGKAATVTGNIEGFDRPEILYDGSTTAPKNAGSHTAIIKYTDTNSNEHSVSVGYTIAKANPDGAKNPAINVVSGVGEFSEPTFNGVDGKTLAGTIKYTISENSNATADDVKNYLKNLEKDSKGSIDYTFTPSDTTNYNDVTGKITFTVVNVEFMVGNETATAQNAVTIKENPTYGDSWADILTLKAGLKAVLSDETVTGSFSLDVTGSPNAGSQTYKVLFNGTIGGITYENLAVVSGTVDVKQKLLTVSAGTYKVSKVYDGNTNPPASGAGTLTVTGLVGNDANPVKVQTIGNFDSANAGTSTVVITVILDSSVTGYENYKLESDTVTVPATITKATQSGTATTPTVEAYNCSSVTLKEEAGYEYSKDGKTWQDSNVFTGLTAGTEYTFYQRIKATTNYEASASSTGVSQTTAAHNYTAKTRNSQTLYRYATCTLAAKYYYSCSVCGDVSKSSTFTYGSPLGHNYTKQVISDSAKISDATCTSPAKYHYSCSRCNLVSTSSSYVFEYGDVKAHSYKEGGICSECNNLKNGKDGFKSVSVTLTDGVIINYFLLLSDTALADKNAYIHFTSAQGVNTKIKLSEGVKDSEGRYKFKLELLPDQMADEITAQVVYSDNTKGNSKAYSVKEYAAAVDNSGSAQAVKDLADAMLNFGAFTQLYTGENTDNLAADVKDYTENAVIGDEYKHKLTSNISDITVKGATLQIGAYTTIRVKYQLAAGAKIEDFTFKCGDTVLTPEKSGDYYYVYLRNIRPQNLDAMYSFTVSDKTGASATLDYSAFSYMKSILDNADKYDKKVVNLINAMYDYNKAAEAISSN